MNSELAVKLRAIQAAIAAEPNWDQEDFSLKQAYICAQLCRLVYEDVAEYEIKRASRIHLFASDTFRSIVKSGVPRSIMASIAGNDFDDRVFVVRGRFALILVVMVGMVAIVAVRGTVSTSLWDWKTNVGKRKYFPRRAPECSDYFFHRGFFEAIVPHIKTIETQLEKRFSGSGKRTIIWTGHSLGGAMAAIGNIASRSSPSYICGVEGAYTFGMPRYGGLGTVWGESAPRHIYNPQDIVPTLPTRRMGFVDSPNEYAVFGNGRIEPSARTDIFGVLEHLLEIKTSVRAHAIENYEKSLAQAIGLNTGESGPTPQAFPRAA